MALTNDDRLILLGLKEAPIATFKIGSPVTSDVIAKLYSNGLLEFEGSGDIVEFSKYNTPWYDYRSNITSVKFKEGNTIKPTSTANLFQGLNKITSIDLSNLNTSNCNNMRSMFDTCLSLTTITGFENLDTSNVTDVSMMFQYCPSLTTLDLSLFDMSEVTTTDYMFMGCSNLSSSITIGSLNIISYTGMFAGCSTEPGSKFVVKYIDNDTKSIAEAMVDTRYPENSNVVLYVEPAYLINGDDFFITTMSLTDNISSIQFLNEPPTDPTPGDILLVSEATSPVKAYMAQLATGGIIVYPEEAGSPLVANESCVGMFGFMSTSISFDNFDTSKVTDMSYMFNGCDGLTSLDLSKFNTSNVTNMEGMFNTCLSLDTITGLENLNTSNVTNMRDMFRDCNSLSSLDLSNWDTSNVTDMNTMFENCNSLSSLDLSNWDTSNVTDMRSMFSGCIGLHSLDLSNLDTSNVTNMNYMFSSCSLSSLDVSNFNTSKVTNMGIMFSGCTNLTEIIGLENFNTSNVTDMNRMFQNCESLNSLDLSNWDTSKVTDMSYMFQTCSSLESLDLSSFDTSKVTNMGYMFQTCSSLESLDLSSFDTSNVTNMRDMFRDCNSLSSLDLSSFDTSKVTNMNYMFNGCMNLLSSIIIRNPNIERYSSMCVGCGRTGTFVIHYITGCETIAQDMVNTKGTGLLAGRTYLGFNIDLITKDSSVSTEITPKIINIIADCAMKQWGYNNTLISIKSIKITYNDQTNLKWSLTYVSDPCEFVYDYTTKTYTCKQHPAQ